MEEWRDFNRYSISNYGNIKSIRFPNRLLKHDIDKYGYATVRLQDKDTPTKQKMFVHRLVASVFLLNPNNNPTVDHINRNKLDNHVDNLRWASRSEQAQNREQRISKPGHKYITFRDTSFRVRCFNFDRKFKTLPEAIEARDKYLTQIIL